MLNEAGMTFLTVTGLCFHVSSSPLSAARFLASSHRVSDCDIQNGL